MIVTAADIGCESVGQLDIWSGWKNYRHQLHHPDISQSVSVTEIVFDPGGVVWDGNRGRLASVRWFAYMLRRRTIVNQFSILGYISTLDKSVAAAGEELPGSKRTSLVKQAARIPGSGKHCLGQIATARILWEYRAPLEGEGLEELYALAQDEFMTNRGEL